MTTLYSRGDLVQFEVNINDGHFETGKETIKGRLLEYDQLARCFVVRCMDGVVRTCPTEQLAHVLQSKR